MAIFLLCRRACPLDRACQVTGSGQGTRRDGSSWFEELKGIDGTLLGVVQGQRLRVDAAGNITERLIGEGLDRIDRGGFWLVGGYHKLAPGFWVGVRWCGTCS